ncbi:helix-turn-helix transcriptional regulator [Planctomycetota bacterium]
MDEVERKKYQTITAKELAKMLSVSPRTIWRLRSAGKLPKPVTFGGSVRWRLLDIRLWQELQCPSIKEFDSRKRGMSHV